MIIRRLSGDTRDYREITSTNDEMNRLLETEDLEEGTVVRAAFQTGGRGYRGNTWSSQRGKNLLFSFLLKPGTLSAQAAFHLSRITSLSLIEVLDNHGIKSDIKWPNDLLAGNRKICGILIENGITGDRISHSVIGVGLNVNQERFPARIPSPTSMLLEKRCHFDMNLLLGDFRAAMESWYQALLAGNEDGIREAYRERLYCLGIPARFADGEHEFTGTIRDVLPEGELEVSLSGGELRCFGFREVTYLPGP